MEDFENEYKPQKQQKEYTVTSSTIFALFGVLALCLLVLVKVLAHFGAGSLTLYGIMSIVIYALSGTGAVLSYLSDRQVKSFEFLLNIGVLALALLAF